MAVTKGDVDRRKREIQKHQFIDDSTRSPGGYGGSLTLLTYPNGKSEVIDRAPDSWEVRECGLRQVTLEMVDGWRERSTMAGAAAQILLEKQRAGDIPDLGAVNDYLKALSS